MDPSLLGSGQLLQRVTGRPHGAFIEFRRIIEAELCVPRVELSAYWKKQTILPSLAYAGKPYQVFGMRLGALAFMISCSRFAMERSGSFNAAIAASTAFSPSSLSLRRVLLPSVPGHEPSSRLFLRL